MSDLIKRSDALQALVDTDEIKGYAYVALEERLQEIPTAQPLTKVIARIEVDAEEIAEHVNDAIRRGGWIPCDKKLPALMTGVLGTDEYGHIRHVCRTIRHGKSRFETVEEGMGVVIIAWMTLPAPWEGATDE